MPTRIPVDWRSFAEPPLLRPAAIAAGRARLASNDWPSALEVATALLDGHPRRLAGIC